MAHWIIRDKGFAGQDYTCSYCGDMFNDIYDAIGDTCPTCGAEMNDDENEYPDDAPEDTPEVRLLTNKEAAGVISNMLSGWRFVRGNAKSMTQLRIIEALCKAVKVLENTPDEGNSSASPNTDIVEFAEKILGFKLLDYQKRYLLNFSKISISKDAVLVMGKNGPMLLKKSRED